MSDKEKKQLMVAIPLLVVALVLVYLLIIRPQMQGGGGRVERSARTTETAAPQPRPGTTTGTTATGTPATEAEAELASQLEVASTEHGRSQQPGRSDPFVPYVRFQKIDLGVGPMAIPSYTVPPVGASLVVPTHTTTEGFEEEHERRMAGMLHNGRIWAIYEKDGVSQIVKPGDPVGDETVVAIGTDYLVLRSIIDGTERQVPLEQMPGYEPSTGTGYPPGGYPRGPGTAPGRPPAPPRPPML